MISKNPLQSSLTQSAYKVMDNLFKDYQKENPSFKYQLSYGTNYDTNCPDDTFSISMELGTINRVPAHYTDMPTGEEILFAGTTQISLSIVNPVAVSYLDELPLTYNTTDNEITDNLYDQSEQNGLQTNNDAILDEESSLKIQDTVRLLEGLSLFIYRKDLSSNNFKFTFLSDLPLITGEFERGKFRLTEALFITCKFQNDSVFNISSGENVKLLFNFGDTNSPDWKEYYGLFDFTFSYGAVDKNYPLANRVAIQNNINQMELKLTISSPAITNVGANKEILDRIYSLDISLLQNVEIMFTEDNGITWKHTRVNITSLDYPRNINSFGTHVYVLHILDKIEQL